MTDFAKPAHELVGPDLPVVNIPNSAVPTPGRGLTLGNNGVLHPSVLAPTPTDAYVLTWDDTLKQQKWAAIPAPVIPVTGYATTLPGSPANGDETILVDSTTAPTYQWRFRYNTGSSNADKWEFVGGAAAFSQVLTSETTASTTYAALATAGPLFALPRAGVYLIETGFRLSSETAVAVNLLMSYDIGGTGAVDADAVRSTVSAVQFTQSVCRSQVKTGLTAVTLTAKYRTDTAGTFGFADRWLRVTPVRVS